MINYTFAGDNLVNVLEALERHNAVLMPEKFAFLMLKNTGNYCRHNY
jgi:hypothetical protein